MEEALLPLASGAGAGLMLLARGWVASRVRRERNRTMMLEDKVAVIYGAGGAVGGAVARAFAREGAEVFLTGRKLPPVEAVAKDIVSAGGSAEAAEVDALDERAMDEHLQSVIDKAGRVDISFNAVGIPDTGDRGRASGRAGSRAVLPADHGLHDVVLPDRAPGGPADGPEQVGGDHDRHRDPRAEGHRRSTEATARRRPPRSCSRESSPPSWRLTAFAWSACDRTACPETDSLKEVFDAKAFDMTWEQWQELLASTTHARRASTLEEMASMAAFMASDGRAGSREPPST